MPDKRAGMVTDQFVLDRVENPHPRMREHALQLRRAARAANDPVLGAMWLGYLEAMCDATGETSDAMNAWLDQHDDPNLAENLRSAQAVQVRGPSRRRS